MDDHLKVLQVVGFKNSGKTTFIEKMVSAVRKSDRSVAVVKHHGHGSLEMHDQYKDTGKFRDNGAEVTGVLAGGSFEMIWNRKDKEWKLDEILALYQAMQLELVFIEGFKTAGLKKIALVRDFEAFEKLQPLVNLFAVITWDKTQFASMENIPLFHITEENLYLPWILTRLGVDLVEE